MVVEALSIIVKWSHITSREFRLHYKIIGDNNHFILPHHKAALLAITQDGEENFEYREEVSQHLFRGLQRSVQL